MSAPGTACSPSRPNDGARGGSSPSIPSVGTDPRRRDSSSRGGRWARGWRDREIEVVDLSPESVGVFDLVLFLGVLYHLTDPLRALQSIFSVTGSHLLLETHVDLPYCPHPAMRFYPNGQLSGDPTSFWGPNPAAVEAMLRWVGFRRVERVARRKVRRPALVGRRHRLDPRHWPRWLRRMEPTMEVFHAWR